MEIKTGTITQYSDIDSGKTLQKVPWSIVDATGTVLLEGNQSFALSATTDDIKAFLTQRLATYKSDAATHSASTAGQADLDNATKVAAEASNLSIPETPNAA